MTDKPLDIDEVLCAECGVRLNSGEAQCFTVCDACWDEAYKNHGEIARAALEESK